ncbi:phosphopantetheine-binding protein [Spirillospora sp. CA-253888]
MIEQGFADLLADHLPEAPRPITEQVRLRDAGLDSVHSIDLLLAIEDAYGIEFPAHLLNDETFDTAGSLWAAVDGTVRGEASSAAGSGGRYG